MNTASKNRPVVFLFGPTGVGKTQLLSEAFGEGYEVVVADSIQVYRGLDIGSAKPDQRERLNPPHHLIDIRDPSEPFDVGDFVSAADRAVDEILARGKVPVLSGGSAYYFVNFLFGLPTTPAAQPQVRVQSKTEWEQLGEPEFRRRLAAVDPVAEARIKPHDAYRLQRAWEVWLQTGRPLSSLERSGTPREGLQVRLCGLDRPRGDLYQRIDQRVGAMMGAGLEDEVRGLLARGFGAQSPGMKGIGYAEFLPWLLEGKGDLASVTFAIAQHSRNYAKRQLTFFRSLPGVEWYHPDQHRDLLNALKRH